jgi:hypothetical protein
MHARFARRENLAMNRCIQIVTQWIIARGVLVVVLAVQSKVLTRNAMVLARLVIIVLRR